jgi:hypothetical protein
MRHITRKRARTPSRVSIPFEPFTVQVGNTLYTVQPDTLPGSSYRIDEGTQAIYVASAVPLASRSVVIAEAIADAWGIMVRSYSKRLSETWRKWDAITTATIEDDFTEDNAGDVFSTFTKLRMLGVLFDPSFAMGIKELRADAKRLNIDGEEDDDMNGLENDDPDEDASDDYFERDDAEAETDDGDYEGEDTDDDPKFPTLETADDHHRTLLLKRRSLDELENIADARFMRTVALRGMVRGYMRELQEEGN